MWGEWTGLCSTVASQGRGEKGRGERLEGGARKHKQVRSMREQNNRKNKTKKRGGPVRYRTEQKQLQLLHSTEDHGIFLMDQRDETRGAGVSKQ
jgi:hypothetical protein